MPGQPDDAGAKVALSPAQLDGDPQDRPEIVLSVLESDQLVAAKERSHLGRRLLTPGVQILLWGLRLYVVAMLALVVVQVVNALHGGRH